MTTDNDDPYHHLHDEAYADGFAKGRVGASALLTMAGRTTQSLNGEWNFVIDPYDEGLRQRWYADARVSVDHWETPRDYDGGDWQPVTVPSSWNLVKPEWFYYEGGAWYERQFHTDPLSGDERLYLRVGASNYEARVFLNGQFIGSHRGGSTPFFLDIGGAIAAGENRLMIQIDNYRRADRLPMHHTDWFNYGGLYREVSLVRVPGIHIRDFSVAVVPGSAGKRLKADVALSQPVSGTASLAIAGLGDVRQIEITAGRGSLEFDAAPDLWHPDHPHLYEVALIFGEDTVRDRLGFRTIEVVGQRILLNGKDVFLRGICAHEDDLTTGKVTSDEDIRRRYGHAKELGCNFMRLAHYPHHERAAEIADEMGILLWEEIPVYWAVDFANPDTYADAENQLLELIRRDRNRASVILWGVGNENADTDLRLSFMRRLAEAARGADGTRLISAACLVNRQKFMIEDRLTNHLDVIGLNEYFGWYEPDFEGLRKLLANSSPDKPVIITETGADAVAGRRDPRATFFSEDLQEEVYRQQLALLPTADYIRGISPWILYDFRAERRQTAFQRGWNRKGLIAADKTTKKRAFAVLAEAYHRMAEEA